MKYEIFLNNCDQSNFLISMTTPERIVNLGLQLGYSETTQILDLCCGYGEMLRIWNMVFNIKGIGVDLCDEFIQVGKLRNKGNSELNLMCADVLNYHDDKKYDIVCCTETLGAVQDIYGTISLLEKYAKSNSKLIFGRLYSKIENPPKELTDFDGEIETLSTINKKIQDCGYYITAIASDTVEQWENYIIWSAKRDINKLRKNQDDVKTRAWLETWYDIYFKYRRQFEGWALFGIEKI